MAEVKSWLKLRGSMGETTFKQVGKKCFANDKVDISVDRIKNHYRYEPLRRNGRQMGNASRSAKLIRTALHTTLTMCNDSRMVGRLNAEVMKVVKLDAAPGAALRGMIARAENMGVLQGFDFNKKVRLRATFNVLFKTEVNRETGEVKINIASFKPASAIKAPRLAKHCCIVAQVAQIDFDPAIKFSDKVVKETLEISEVIQLNNTPTAPLTMTFKIKPGNVNTIMIALGVDFLDQSHPLYRDNNARKKVSCGCIVRVDEGVAVPFSGKVYESEEEEDGV